MRKCKQNRTKRKKKHGQKEAIRCIGEKDVDLNLEGICPDA